jgi:hypothetical protein
MFAFILIVALDLHTPAKKGEFLKIVFFITGFCIIAAVVSQLLQTNYAGFYECNVGPINDLRLMLIEKVNYPVIHTVYVVGFMAVHYGFVCGLYALYKLIRRLTKIKTLAPVS